ncbi:ABC transporter substrate-binding protein [Shewanella sp. SR44-3]|uniref:substrate-binding periplasmic protein n=1 Tax=unclassified Shewanella TaxID=196818 RepID=UPI0015F9F7BE|nr:transporter substrate-binding domain-containing protein [Shewanella sp. SR44-3]MBB1270928.1 amino acid ABC transporter substrate-binding protein [Shewanella sp. SR44-3]
MKRVLIILFLLSHFLFIAKAQEPLVFVTSDYPPYVINNNGIANGMIPELIKAVFKDTDIEVEFKFQPWNRGQLSVSKGLAFAAFPYVFTDERAKDFDFSDPFLAFFPKFFYKKTRFPNGFSWQELADFHGYRMGGVRGFWYQASFDALGLNVSYVSTDLQNMTMLLKDRIDFTLIDELVGWDLIRTHIPENIADFSVVTKPESRSALHLMISREYPNAKALTQTFNQGLQKLKDNGIYQNIIEKYHAPKEYSTSPKIH